MPPPQSRSPFDSVPRDDDLRFDARPATGTVVAIGVFNILFALACGCANGVGTLATSLGSEEMQVAFKEGVSPEVDEAWEEELQKADSEEERRRLESARAFMESEEVKESMVRMAETVAASPEASTLRIIATLGLVAQLAFFVSGVLLLVRMPVARPLGIAAAAATLVLTPAFVVYANRVTDLMGDSLLAVEESMQEPLDTQGRPDAADVRRTLEGTAELLQTPTNIITSAVGGIGSLYPLIALLVLLFSNGVRQALHVTPSGPPPDGF